MMTTDAAPLYAVEFTTQNRTIVRLMSEAAIPEEVLFLRAVGLTMGNATPISHANKLSTSFPAPDATQLPQARTIIIALDWVRNHALYQQEQIKPYVDATRMDLPDLAPTFLTEVARILAHDGATFYARQYFAEALETAVTQRIPLNMEQHMQVFSEFSALNLVGAKHLHWEAQLTALHLEPRQAFDYFLQLNVAHMRAGHEEYPNLPHDLRHLGQAAGLHHTEVDRILVANTLRLPGFAAFVKSIRKPLIALVRDTPEYQEYLLAHQPVGLSRHDYLDILRRARIVDKLP